MDWILSITTLAANWGLGWFKGVWWIWLLHALNAGLWIVYSLLTKQYGFVFLSIVTIIMDLITSYKRRSNAE